MTGARAIAVALAAALLFGASTPAAKLLAGAMSPFMLAGWLYAGSGAGLAAWLALRRARGAPIAPLAGADAPWLAGAVLAGGVAGPVLLMAGLQAASAATASLLLNLESAFTALLAWFVFGENAGRRVVAGLALVVAGGVLASLDPSDPARVAPGALLIAGACLAWAIDNNLTRKVSAADPALVAAIKGLAAGATSLGLAAALGDAWPAPHQAAAAAVVGLFGYGVSLSLFVLALRELGAARTGAYFSVAPFAGIALAVLALGEAPAPAFWLGALLVAIGVWLHATEKHSHEHAHAPMSHEHAHVHDEHHRHAHDFDWDGREPHVHAHRHEAMRHSHPHAPDIHHRHEH